MGFSRYIGERAALSNVPTEPHFYRLLGRLGGGTPPITPLRYITAIECVSDLGIGTDYVIFFHGPCQSPISKFIGKIMPMSMEKLLLKHFLCILKPNL